MIAASSASGGRSSEPPAHSAPSERENSWLSASPSRVNAKTRRPLPARDLADDVCGGAEPVEPDALRVAGQNERAIADQPGAEQRGRLQIRIPLGDWEAEALVRDGFLGKAAVDVVAGEAGAVTEVLAPAAAVAALAARPAEPRDSDAFA